MAPLSIPEFLLYQRPIEPIRCLIKHPNWEQVGLNFGDQEELFDGPAEIAAETSSSTRITEPLRNYVLFDVDCPLTNINITTASELTHAKLPGIGQILAQRIVDYRDINGPFQSEKGLIAVPGIGPKKFD